MKQSAGSLRLLSVVIPARDEEACLGVMLDRLRAELQREEIPHEIVVVDDGSVDGTWAILQAQRLLVPGLRPVQNSGLHGFGRAVVCGLDAMCGDAVVIMMADESDAPRDVVRYWRELQAGVDCVFGSRFVSGGEAIDYPPLKRRLNRLANALIAAAFGFRFNDTTNAFKAYRRTAIDACRPLRSAHFELTVELPLKAAIRGLTWKAVPVTWRNRRAGATKLKLGRMAGRYLLTCLRLLAEKHFRRTPLRPPR